MTLNRTFLNGFAAGVLSVLLLILVFVAGAHYPAANSKIALSGSNKPTAAEAKPAQPQEAGESAYRGVADAPITIVEYADFHCPFCKKATPAIEQLMAEYPGKLRWEFHHYPLSPTPNRGSWLTHESSACAGKQGKFWEYTDELYANQQLISVDYLTTLAKQLGLNSSDFEDCLTSGKYKALVNENQQEALSVGVTGTPGVYVNDQLVKGALPYESFKQIIDSILAK